MKKIFYVLIGMLIMGGVVYATDLLMDAKSISYSSEYTESDNVAAALNELLEGGNSFSSLHEEYPTLTILSSNNTMWCDNSPYLPCSSYPTFGYKYITVTVRSTHSSGGSGSVSFNGTSIGTLSYSSGYTPIKLKMTDDDTVNGTVQVCVNGSSSWPSIISNITYSME